MALYSAVHPECNRAGVTVTPRGTLPGILVFILLDKKTLKIR